RTDILKEHDGIASDHPESVVTTLSLSFERIQQTNPAALELLQLCAFLHPDTIPEEIITNSVTHLGSQLLATVTDPSSFNKAIKALLSSSLLHRDSAAHTLTVHRLVQAVLKESMNTEAYQQRSMGTVKAVNSILPEPEVTNWSQWE